LERDMVTHVQAACDIMFSKASVGVDPPHCCTINTVAPAQPCTGGAVRTRATSPSTRYCCTTAVGTFRLTQELSQSHELAFVTPERLSDDAPLNHCYMQSLATGAQQCAQGWTTRAATQACAHVHGDSADSACIHALEVSVTRLKFQQGFRCALALRTAITALDRFIHLRNTITHVHTTIAQIALATHASTFGARLREHMETGAGHQPPLLPFASLTSPQGCCTHPTDRKHINVQCSRRQHD
jgi:hypothetical protein